MKDTLQYREEDGRIIVSINGKDRHQLDDVLGSIAMFRHPLPKHLESFQLFTDARIISSGFCVEDCCPSMWVRITESTDSVIIHSPHKSIDMSGTQEQCEDFRYELDKTQFLDASHKLLGNALVMVTAQFQNYLNEQPNKLLSQSREP